MYLERRWNIHSSHTHGREWVCGEYSGRAEGSEAKLMEKYGADRVELAYSPSGAYLGYGYLNETLSILQQSWGESCTLSGASSNIALWRAKIQPSVELVVDT